jgi:predicted phage tail protein
MNDSAVSSGHHRIDVADTSLGELMGNITRDLSTLLQQEVKLAKAELTADAKQAGRAASMLGAAALAAVMVLVFLSCAAWWGLANVMDEGWAALIVTAVWAVIGASLYVVGRNRLRTVDMKPQRTVDTLQEIPDALKPHEETR